MPRIAALVASTATILYGLGTSTKEASIAATSIPVAPYYDSLLQETAMVIPPPPTHKLPFGYDSTPILRFQLMADGVAQEEAMAVLERGCQKPIGLGKRGHASMPPQAPSQYSNSPTKKPRAILQAEIVEEGVKAPGTEADRGLASGTQSARAAADTGEDPSSGKNDIPMATVEKVSTDMLHARVVKVKGGSGGAARTNPFRVDGQNGVQQRVHTALKRNEPQMNATYPSISFPAASRRPMFPSPYPYYHAHQPFVPWPPPFGYQPMHWTSFPLHGPPSKKSRYYSKARPKNPSKSKGTSPSVPFGNVAEGMALTDSFQAERHQEDNVAHGVGPAQCNDANQTKETKLLPDAFPLARDAELGSAVASQSEQAGHCRRNYAWTERMEQLQLFKSQHGHLRVPTKYDENGTRLGRFVRDTRQKFKKNDLCAQQIDDLNAMGFVWYVYEWSGRETRP